MGFGREKENKGEKPLKKTQINYEFQPHTTEEETREFLMSEKLRFFWS
jgi:hypothetical protein